MEIFKKGKNKIILSTVVFSFVLFFALSFSPSVFAEPCDGVDKSGTPIPYGCEGNEIGTPNPKLGTPDPKLGTPDPKLGTPTNTKIDAHIENPLGDSIVDIPSFIAKILDFILMLGIPIVALAIIYTGFLFVTALGNSEKLKKAKDALVYTLIGGALLLGAFVIAEAIRNTVVDISNEAMK